MTIKAVVFAVLPMLLAPGTSLAANTAFSYQRNLGVAAEVSGRTCLDIRNADLSAGQKIQFINTDSPATTGEAQIARKIEQTCMPANEKLGGLSHYELTVDKGVLTKSAPAFAIAGFAGELTLKGTGVIGDLDGDGHPDAFRSCTSTEGVHLTVWKGRPLRGVRRWHFYYYLGYDVEPTCTKHDTKPGSR